MISPERFFNSLKDGGVRFFTGVPDSLLKDFCAYVEDHVEGGNHIIAANEGAAIAIAVGNHLATNAISLVYMQNSGLGNAVNPLISIADPEVYSIPILLLIGWRGQPGVTDEPQHRKQGRITLEMLRCMEIPYEVISPAMSGIEKVVQGAFDWMRKNGSPFALVVEKDSFQKYSLQSKPSPLSTLSREAAIGKVLKSVRPGSVVISTTGKISREVFEWRERMGAGHQMDFLTVGSMGHASQIALGVATSQPGRSVLCLDGDGAVIMHMGALAVLGAMAPPNYTHIVLNNGVHESVGGQPTVANLVDISGVASACGYKTTLKVRSESELTAVLNPILQSQGPSFLEILVGAGSREDLGRPTKGPIENKEAFMAHLRP